MFLFKVVLLSCLGCVLAFRTALLGKAFKISQNDVKLHRQFRNLGPSKSMFHKQFSSIDRCTTMHLSFIDELDQPSEKYVSKVASTSPVDDWLEKKGLELAQAHSVKDLTRLYSTILLETCKNSEDPMQTTAFQTLSRRFAFRLVSAFPLDVPLPELMDIVTKAHFSAINDLTSPMQRLTDDEEKAQATNCYHFASLAYYTYLQVYDKRTSSVTEMDATNMRDDKYLAPVLLRLASRCPSFDADSAHLRVAEINSADFKKMVNSRMRLELEPKLTLPAAAVDFSGATVVHREDPVFHAGSLAHSVDTTLRKTVQESELSDLEMNVGNAFRLNIANRARDRVESLRESSRTHVLTEDRRSVVENLLNIAHESVAAVLVQWQIRHNMVGVPEEVEEGEGGDDSDGFDEPHFRKDFLHSVQLPAPHNISREGLDSLLECIPPDLRGTVAFDLEELTELFHPSPLLAATAVLGAAVRYGAAEDFRALSMYDAGQEESNEDSEDNDDEVPLSRDQIYTMVLAEVLASTLLAERFDEHLFCQHLLAFAALEETLGVAEPRAGCRAALNAALRLVVLRLRDSINAAVPFDPSSKAAAPALPAKINSFVSVVRDRLSLVEKGLHMVLRLPEGESAEAREETFSWITEYLLASDPDTDEKPASMREVARDVPWMGALLSVDPEEARDALAPLGQEKFDSLVEDMLLNADVAMSMPELGASIEKQIMSVAESLLISAEDAEGRVIVLASAATSTMLLEALEQHLQDNFANADLMIAKAFYIYQHPLLKRLQGRADRDLKEFGLTMAITQLGGDREGLLSLIRMLEAARARRAAAKDGLAAPVQQTRQGWGSENGVRSAPEISGVLEFVQSMQAFLLQEFTSGEYL